MRIPKGRAALALLAAVCLASLTGCGSHSLGASSTCSQFMNASTSAQDQVVDSLAQKYDKPELATPLGRPEVPYECSGEPNLTLGELFAREQD